MMFAVVRSVVLFQHDLVRLRDFREDGFWCSRLYAHMSLQACFCAIAAITVVQ